MSITAPLLAYSGEWGSFLMWKTSFSYQYNSGYLKYLVMLNMTPGNAIFWHLTSNRDWHRKKKEEIFKRERASAGGKKKQTKKRTEGGKDTEESTAGMNQTCPVVTHLLESLPLPWKSSLILQLMTWANYSHGISAKIQTIKTKASLPRLYRFVCAFYFSFNLTSKIEFMMAESGTWRSI